MTITPNELPKTVLFIFGIAVLTTIGIILILHFVFPATWSCEFNEETQICWCGWDNRPTQEYGYSNYSKEYCESIGKVVNNTEAVR